MHHPIVTDHPDFMAIASERDRLAKARAAFTDRIKREEVEHDQALLEYGAATRAALRDGTEPPEMPVRKPGLGGHMASFVDEAIRLNDAEREFLAEEARDLTERLEEREEQLVGMADSLVAQLDALAAETQLLVSSTRQIRRANPNAGDARDIYPDAVDAAALVMLVSSGARTFLCRPVVGRRVGFEPGFFVRSTV